MKPEEISAIVIRQLAAEADYLEAVSWIPAIRAERRRILEEAERDLAAAVAEVLSADVCSNASGCPDGVPDFRTL